MTTSNPPKKTEHRRPWIKYQLDLLGLNLSDIARELNVCRQAVCHVFDKPRSRVEHAIAGRLGLQPEEIWPERYEPKTKSPRKRRCHKNTKAGGVTQSLKCPPV